SGKYNPGTFAVGTHSLKAIAYSAAQGGGTKLNEIAVSFKVISGTTSPAPNPTTPGISLKLIDANKNSEITTLSNGYQLNLSTIGTNAFNVDAIAPGVSSIVFTLNGVKVRTESY